MDRRGAAVAPLPRGDVHDPQWYQRDSDARTQRRQARRVLAQPREDAAAAPQGQAGGAAATPLTTPGLIPSSSAPALPRGTGAGGAGGRLPAKSIQSAVDSNREGPWWAALPPHDHVPLTSPMLQPRPSTLRKAPTGKAPRPQRLVLVPRQEGANRVVVEQHLQLESLRLASLAWNR